MDTPLPVPMGQTIVPFVFIPAVGLVLLLWLHRTGRLDRPRAWTLALGLFFFALTEAGRIILRPYIYNAHPDHPLLANTLGNSLGTLTAVYIVVAVAGGERRKDVLLIALVVFGLVAYELSNSLSGYPVDPQDIAATLICGAAAYPLYRFIHRKSRASG